MLCFCLKISSLVRCTVSFLMGGGRLGINRLAVDVPFSYIEEVIIAFLLSFFLELKVFLIYAFRLGLAFLSGVALIFDEINQDLLARRIQLIFSNDVLHDSQNSFVFSCYSRTIKMYTFNRDLLQTMIIQPNELSPPCFFHDFPFGMPKVSHTSLESLIFKRD